MGQRPTPEILIYASTSSFELDDVEQNSPAFRHQNRA
jgi:hypothetical protein